MGINEAPRIQFSMNTETGHKIYLSQTLFNYSSLLCRQRRHQKLKYYKQTFSPTENNKFYKQQKYSSRVQLQNRSGSSKNQSSNVDSDYTL